MLKDQTRTNTRTLLFNAHSRPSPRTVLLFSLMFLFPFGVLEGACLGKGQFVFALESTKTMETTHPRDENLKTTFRCYKFLYFQEPRKPRDERFENNPFGAPILCVFLADDLFGVLEGFLVIFHRFQGFARVKSLAFSRFLSYF